MCNFPKIAYLVYFTMLLNCNLFKLILTLNCRTPSVSLELMVCVCFPAMSLGGTVDVLTTEDPDAVAQEDEELQVYEKHNNLLHGSKKKR